MEEKEMSFWGHLEELRRTLFRVVAVLLVFMIACFCVMPDLFDSFVLGPTTSDFFLYRWLSNLGGTGMFLPDFSNDDFAVEIININVASQFLTHISTSFWFALVLMFPYLIFEVWRFVQPALFENERRSVGLAFLGGTVMFFLGCAVDGCRIGQRIAIGIRKHFSHIQRPGITECYISCGNCTGSDRRCRLAFIGEGEEMDGRIAGAAVILRRIGSSATICTQHKALLDRGPILGGMGVVQGNCDCDIPIALRIGHFYTAASPLRHIGVVAGCFTARGIGQYGSVFVGGLYIGRACGNGDQVVGHILESRVAGKGHRVLHTDGCRSCGLVIRTIWNNTIQRRSYCALFRCKDCRGKDG